MSTALPRCIAVATPHARHDAMLDALRRRLAGCEVVRIGDRAALDAGRLAAIRPDVIFFPHWSWIIPPALHRTYECVVFHMTDLPYGRGGSPLQNLIARGHRETMMSALRCTDELDAGPIYLKRPLDLDGTAEAILRRASALIEDMIVEVVMRRPQPVEQRGEVVHFVRRRPQDGDLSALDDLARAYDTIRMLDGDGYPRAFLQVGALRFEFDEASQTGDAVVARVRITRAGHA